MSTTLKVSLPSVSGEAGPFTLFLRKTSDQSLVNSGGDSLTEIEVSTVKSGVWNAVVSETLPAEDLHARIYEGTTETSSAILLDGRLFEGETELGVEPAAAGGGGGVTDWTSTERAQIRYRLGLDGTATAPTDPAADPIVVTPATGDTTTAYLTCLSSALAAQSGVTVYQALLNLPPADRGKVYAKPSSWPYTSSGAGLVEMPCLKGGTYRFWRGTDTDNGIVVTIPADAGSTFELPSLIGSA